MSKKEQTGLQTDQPISQRIGQSAGHPADRSIQQTGQRIGQSSNQYQTNQLVRIEHLTKRYDNKTALNDISLTLAPGSIVGLLGPNGSGKTTLIRILGAVNQVYTGAVTIDGHKPGPHTKGIVSYLPDKTYFSDWMRPRDVIRQFQEFYTDFNTPKCEEMVSRLSLNVDQKIKTMSKGTVEKFQLCLTMSRDARLYLLDEPIGGVDPAARDFILDTILNHYSEHSTILMSTHLIADVERIFDTVIFLKDGDIALHDQIDTVRAEKGKSIDALFREVFKC